MQDGPTGGPVEMQSTDSTRGHQAQRPTGQMPGTAGPSSRMPNCSFLHKDLILLQTIKLLLSFFSGAF